MKKVLFIVLALVLFLGILFFFYQIKFAKSAIENVLPSDAIAYVRVSDIEKNLNEFKSTKLWRKIKNIDIEKVMQKSGAGQQDLEAYRKFNKELSRFTSNILWNKFFGQEIALAIYPADGGKTYSQDLLKSIPNIVVVSRITSDAQFVEFITKIYQKFDKTVPLKKEDYQGKEVTIVEVNKDFSLAYAKVKDLLIISLDKKQIFACLDVYGKVKPSLKDDTNYLSVSSQLPKNTKSIVYLNFKMIFSDIERFINSNNSSEAYKYGQRGFEKLSRLNGFKALGYGSASDEKITKSRIILAFDKNLIDRSLAAMYSLKSTVSSSMDFVPKNIIGYQRACFSPQAFWESLKDELSQKESISSQPAFSPTQIIKEIESNLGVSIEKEILPALGNEYGTLLSDVNLSGPIPIPELTLFIKVNNKTVIENIFNNLVQKNNIPLSSEDYQGVTIKHVPLPFGTSLQPAYCFIGDYLLISVNDGLLKFCLDSSRNKANSLSANENFHSLGINPAEKNNSLFFMNTNLLIDRMRGIGDWAMSWISMQYSRQEAFQKDIEIQVDDLKERVKNEEAEHKNFKEKYDNIKGQVPIDPAKQTELSELEKQMAVKEKNLGVFQKELTEKQSLYTQLEASAKQQMSLPLIKFYLDEVIYPVLDGLKMIKSVVSITNFKENFIETDSYYLIEN